MSSRKAIADAAASHLDALDRDLVARGGLRLGASTGDLTLVAALRALLIQRAADATSASVVPSPSLARVALHRVSSRARGRLRTILRSTPGSTPAARRRVVLMVPREPHHLRDMVPVADQLATRDVRVVWLVFTDDAHDRLRAEGHQVMHAEGLGQPRATEVVRLSQEVLRWSRDRGIEDPVVRAVHEAIVALAPRAVDPLLVSADAVRRIVETLNPALVVVGNASTPDGVVALATARVAGIPTATL